MAADTFLKIEGIPGESQDSKHSGEIEILSYNWGASQPTSFGTGGGGGVGKATVSDISFMKKADKASPVLFLSLVQGKHIPSALLTVRKAGGENPLEYSKIKLTDVIVSSYQTSHSDGNDLPMDSVSLNFSKIEYEVTPQSSKGAGEGVVKAGWDLSKGVKV